MDKNSTVFGFIGTGNMGGALAQAARHTIEGSRILLANRSPEKALALAQALEARVSDNQEIAKEADFIVLGVKPHSVP